MPVSEQQIRTAYLGGRFAAHAGKPLTACPFNPQERQLLTVWFIRGYQSIGARADTTTDVRNTGEGEQ